MRQTPILRITAALAIGGAALTVMPGAAATARDAGSQPAVARIPSAVVRDVNGTVLGTVRFEPGNGRITVVGRLTGLTGGFHGMHVHAIGVCNPAATDPVTGAVVPFGTAGGHLNPGAATHGHHAGDLPPILVASDGRTITVTDNDQLTLANLFDADGSAVVVHALPDNLANIPARYSAAGVPGPDAATLATGDSGGRVACGVVTR
jgi:Cu-Zn family superoxide dismutase